MLRSLDSDEGAGYGRAMVLLLVSVSLRSSAQRWRRGFLAARRYLARGSLSVSWSLVFRFERHRWPCSKLRNNSSRPNTNLQGKNFKGVSCVQENNTAGRTSKHGLEVLVNPGARRVSRSRAPLAARRVSRSPCSPGNIFPRQQMVLRLSHSQCGSHARSPSHPNQHPSMKPRSQSPSIPKIGSTIT
jgi:hypothetical protein